MAPWLNPAAWNGIGIVTFLIIAFTGLVVALFKGWIVLGVHHREIVGQKDREITAAHDRSVEDGKSIAKFAEASMLSATTAEMQQAVVTAIREVAQEKAR